MKPTQKIIIKIEKLSFVVAFKDIDKTLLPLVAGLEKFGDEFGPFTCLSFIPQEVCISVMYADKRRGPVKPTIFGFDSDDFMLKQYK